MDSTEERVEFLKSVIALSADIVGLNLTIQDGKLGFVDQKRRRIVAVWEPGYSLGDLEVGR